MDYRSRIFNSFINSAAIIAALFVVLLIMPPVIQVNAPRL